MQTWSEYLIKIENLFSTVHMDNGYYILFMHYAYNFVFYFTGKIVF